MKKGDEDVEKVKWKSSFVNTSLGKPIYVFPRPSGTFLDKDKASDAVLPMRNVPL